MRKPIFIVTCPSSARDEFDAIIKSLDDALGHDYHVLCFISNLVEDFEFKQFNDSNITDIQLEDLRKELNIITK